MTDTNIEEWTVLGMTCGGCASAVERTLGGMAGLVRVKADAASDSVLLEFKAGAFSPEQARQRIQEAGFEVGDHG